MRSKEGESHWPWGRYCEIYLERLMFTWSGEHEGRHP